MTQTTLDPHAGRARRSALPHGVAMQLAATEYDRVLDLLRSLPADAWSKPTVNTEWNVRDLAGHMLGMVEMLSSTRETKRQVATARNVGGVFIDALTALQVRERRELGTAELLDRWAVAAPKAVSMRRRTPAPIRRFVKPIRDQPIGPQPGCPLETWTLGYLNDVINTRDPWMHRCDIVSATGAAHVLTADHDGVIVDDVVREWAGRHRQPYNLRLTGPCGGTWSGASGGSGGPPLTLDAVEFCRILSGRGAGDGLLGTPVPF